MFTEYGTGKITMVYVVNSETREDVMMMPVLFTENRKVMATIMQETAERHGRV